MAEPEMAAIRALLPDEHAHRCYLLNPKGGLYQSAENGTADPSEQVPVPERQRIASTPTYPAGARPRHGRRCRGMVVRLFPVDQHLRAVACRQPAPPGASFNLQ